MTDTTLGAQQHISIERKRSIRRAIIGSGAGNIVEQYDFALYSVVAAIAFGTLFFPAMDPWSALLASFATYSIGFVARPLGSIVAGHFGDIYGRKKVLVLMLLIAGGSTAAIGLLPTYSVAGVWAPVLLVTLRFLQGFSVGGEYSGAVLLVSETAPRNRRGFFTGFIPASSSLGLVICYLIILAFASVPQPIFLEWVWRLPFLFSVVLVAVGFFVRSKVAETPAFKSAQPAEKNQTRRLPLLQAFGQNPKAILVSAGVTFGFGIFVYVTITWLLGYLGTGLKLPSSVGLTGLLIGMTINALSSWASSAASDRLGRRPVIVSGAVLMALWAFPMFWLVDTANPVLIWTAMSVALIFCGMVNGPLACLMTELFATQYRYSGGSIAYQLGQTLGGGFAPLIATALITFVRGSWAVALFVIIGGVVTVISALCAPETAGTDLAKA